MATKSKDRSSRNKTNKNDGLRKLNKELITRNAELVKKLHRSKMEKDKFEQLFNDWKHVNKDTAEALNALHKDNKKLAEENAKLRHKLATNDLSKNQNNGHGRRHSNNNNSYNTYTHTSSSNIDSSDTITSKYNSLKFNYQQKKLEVDTLLLEFSKLFQFFSANYPDIFQHIKASNHHHQNHPDHYEMKSPDAEMTLSKSENIFDKKSKNKIQFKSSVSMRSFFDGPNKMHNGHGQNGAVSLFPPRRDSIGKKKKKKSPRINAIPSSTNDVGLMTPQQSWRERDSDDDMEEQDPQKYLNILGKHNDAYSDPILSPPTNDGNGVYKDDVFDLMPQNDDMQGYEANNGGNHNNNDHLQGINESGQLPIGVPCDSDSSED